MLNLNTTRLLCVLGLHDEPLRDVAKDGIRVLRCPRCMKVTPLKLNDSDPLADARNDDPRHRMPAREQYAIRSAQVRRMTGIEVRRRGTKVLPFKRGA